MQHYVTNPTDFLSGEATNRSPWNARLRKRHFDRIYAANRRQAKREAEIAAREAAYEQGRAAQELADSLLV